MSDDRCWKLIAADGRDPDGDFDEQHYPSRLRATEARPGSDVRAVQLDHPCVHVACAGCGELFDLEGENFILHFADRTEGLASVRDFGWTVIGDSAWCLADECTAAAKQAKQTTETAR